MSAVALRSGPLNDVAQPLPLHLRSMEMERAKERDRTTDLPLFSCQPDRSEPVLRRSSADQRTGGDSGDVLNGLELRPRLRPLEHVSKRPCSCHRIRPSSKRDASGAGCYAHAVAEHTLGALLSAARRDGHRK
jgi:hypothetical protein